MFIVGSWLVLIIACNFYNNSASIVCSVCFSNEILELYHLRTNRTQNFISNSTLRSLSRDVRYEQISKKLTVPSSHFGSHVKSVKNWKKFASFWSWPDIGIKFCQETVGEVRVPRFILNKYTQNLGCKKVLTRVSKIRN